MNEQQIKWINSHISKMRSQIENIGAKNLADEEWLKINTYINDLISKAKGHEVEVRKMLFDFIEPYDREVNWNG